MGDASALSYLLRALRMDDDFNKNVTAWWRVPARPAGTIPFPTYLDARLREALAARGITDLYTHQAAAIDALRGGGHVAVVTPAASGKTLCYNLLVADALLRDPLARALYLFPTKALAQDQLAELNALFAALPASPLGKSPAAVYDGDTPVAQRRAIRKTARIIITNPDMLHVGILPQHTNWGDFLANLRFVIVDEMHTYRGVFGSHVANVLRRLRRLCDFYGARPQFVCASATIDNPKELAERLLEAPVTLVDQEQNGAPTGEKHFILYNPPLVDRALGIRRSAVLEAQRLAADFIAHDVQTIVFARSRLTTEVLLTYLRDSAKARHLKPETVRGYRGGYLPTQRREIEAGLREGTVRGVVATNALELGIDIGQMGAAVLTGYPGTIASTWQQAGRAGRRADISVAILIASASPLDQYLVTHPRYFFERTPEQALINPDNDFILLEHAKCAAFELPFRVGEAFGESGDAAPLLEYLAEEKVVKQVGDTWYWLAEGYPAEKVSLRTAGAENVVILDVTSGTPQVIGQVDCFSAPRLVHEGAIYLHEGEPYQVDKLDWEGARAEVRAVAVDHYTEANISESVQVLDVFAQEDAGPTHKAHGEVAVISRATGYRVLKRYTHETLGWGEINLPEQEMQTTGYWLSLAPEVVERLRAAGAWLEEVDYGPNWSEQRNAARARDGYRCRQCGAPERPDREHDVHHVRPFRAFGYIPGQNTFYLEANSLDNLVTLCHDCHQRAEARQRLRSGLAGLAYVLRELAPLYLMCDPADLGSVTEARSAHNGLPTITLYDRIPAGIGFAARLYELHDALLAAAQESVRACPCETGCPACVGPVSEGDVDAKRLTSALLAEVLKE